MKFDFSHSNLVETQNYSLKYLTNDLGVERNN